MDLLYTIHLIADVLAHVSIGFAYGSHLDQKFRKDKLKVETERGLRSKFKKFVERNYHTVESIIISVLPDIDSVPKIGIAKYVGKHRWVPHSLFPTAIVTGLYTKWRHNDFKRGFFLLLSHLLLDLASGGPIYIICVPDFLKFDFKLWPHPEYTPNPVFGFIIDIILHSSVIVACLLIRFKPDYFK